MNQNQKPNIVVMVSHDTGRFISPYGINTLHMPNAEKFAAEGVLFENHFCTAPSCCPSRAGIFSGCAPHTVGMLGQAGAWAGFRFSDEVTHAAKHFKNLGYNTMLLGLAHEVAGNGCPDSYFDNIGFDSMDRFDSLPSSWIPEKLAALLDNRTEPDKPFYLQIGVYETHIDYLRDGIQPYREKGITVLESPALTDGPGTREEFSELQGCANRLDEGLGHVMKILEDRNVADNTLFVFTTDHGIPVPRAKTTLYDQGIGTFLMMRFPGVFKAGERKKELVSNIDLLPTLIEAAGGKVPEQIQGKSMLPLLTGGDYQPNEVIFAEKTFHTSYDPIRCVRTKRYKYIFNFESVRPENYCLDIYNKPILLESFALLDTSANRFDELYDLENDPMETKNLAGEEEYKDLRRQLATELANWMKRTDDPLLKGPVGAPRFFEKVAWIKEHITE